MHHRRMSTTNSNFIPKKDNCPSLNWMVNKSATRPPSSRSSHRSSRRTSMLDWARNRETSRMPWSRWLKIIWHSSSCHGEQRILARWSMDTRSTSSNRSAARFPTLSWASSSSSTTVIGWVVRSGETRLFITSWMKPSNRIFCKFTFIGIEDRQSSRHWCAQARRDHRVGQGGLEHSLGIARW